MVTSPFSAAGLMALFILLAGVAWRLLATQSDVAAPLLLARLDDDSRPKQSWRI